MRFRAPFNALRTMKFFELSYKFLNLCTCDIADMRETMLLYACPRFTQYEIYNNNVPGAAGHEIRLYELQNSLKCSQDRLYDSLVDFERPLVTKRVAIAKRDASAVELASVSDLTTGRFALLLEPLNEIAYHKLHSLNRE